MLEAVASSLSSSRKFLFWYGCNALFLFYEAMAHYRSSPRHGIACVEVEVISQVLVMSCVSERYLCSSAEKRELRFKCFTVVQVIIVLE